MMMLENEPPRPRPLSQLPHARQTRHRAPRAQGIESNVRHHRRLLPLFWGETRQDDHFAHFPHGGRLDSRVARPSSSNISQLGNPEEPTWTVRAQYQAPIYHAAARHPATSPTPAPRNRRCTAV